LGIGDWAQSPIPNPQSPIPNPHFYFLISIKNKNNQLLIKRKVIKNKKNNLLIIDNIFIINSFISIKREIKNN
jgi:hypothetical protein